MTAVTETYRKVAVMGEVKLLMIRVATTTGTGETVDMNQDATDGKGMVMEEITDAYHVGETGTRVDASWNATTGIVTLGTIASPPGDVSVFIWGY